MRYYCELGAVRWLRHTGRCDVRGHLTPKGWEASADMLEYHPTTGEPLDGCEWWIRETYTGYDK